MFSDVASKPITSWYSTTMSGREDNVRPEPIPKPRGAAPKMLPKPALMAGGTRILGGGRLFPVVSTVRYLSDIGPTIARSPGQTESTTD
ncbi:hypothetical protein J6590_066261 [Homalodisca vitripennis]|nr:hypothetical protein J6590_066261 [Homalodisca vitripennis]